MVEAERHRAERPRRYSGKAREGDLRGQRGMMQIAGSSKDDRLDVPDFTAVEGLLHALGDCIKRCGERVGQPQCVVKQLLRRQRAGMVRGIEGLVHLVLSRCI